MDDDELLRLLGREQRESLAGSETDEAGDVPPLEADERESMLDDLFGALEHEEGGAQAERGELQPAQPSDVPAPAEAAAPQLLAPVVDLSARRKRNAMLFGSLGTLAAAGVLLWWGLAQPEKQLAVAELPSYSVERLDGGIQATRGEERRERVRVRRDSTIDWVFTPARPVGEGVGVGIVAKPEQGELRLVSPIRAEISAEGAIRLRGKLSEHVELEPGRWTLEILIAPVEQLPRTLAQLDAPVVWQQVEVELQVEASE